MLNNAKNNAVAMQELQSLLAKCETAVIVDFYHLNHHIWYFAHIINICTSHIISSMTSVSKQLWYLSELEVPVNSNCTFHHDSENKLDNDNIDIDFYIEKLELDDSFDDCGNPKLKEQFAGIKHDPLRHACRII